MKEKNYYPVDKQTNEVLPAVKASYRGGIYHIPRDALESEPLPSKQGFAVIAVLDKSGKVIVSEYIEDHRDTTIYDESDCTKLEVVSELGPIKEGFTPDKPLTVFDERISDSWVTNQRKKYITEYDQVDSVRRTAYREVSDPLYMEAWRKESKGLANEAADFRQQADAAVELIQAEHPWPTPPELSSEV